MRKFKEIIRPFCQPKAFMFGLAIFLLFYVNDKEWQVNSVVGCYDCSLETRQAFYLLISTIGVLRNRWWSCTVSLLASLTVMYSVGHVAFWNNNIAEVGGRWGILPASLAWSWRGHQEYFVELAVAAVVSMYAVKTIWQGITKLRFRKRRYLTKACNGRASQQAS